MRISKNQTKLNGEITCIFIIDCKTVGSRWGTL
jgi:hypothetical protein